MCYDHTTGFPPLPHTVSRLYKWEWCLSSWLLDGDEVRGIMLDIVVECGNLLIPLHIKFFFLRRCPAPYHLWEICQLSNLLRPSILNIVKKKKV